MNAPLLLNHNREHQIGHMDNGVVTLLNGKEMSRAEIFDTFGNASVEILEIVGNSGPHGVADPNAKVVRKFRLLEWSFDPKPAHKKPSIEDYKSFVGRDFKVHRETLGLNQEAAAKLLGIKQSYFSQIEKGKRSVYAHLFRYFLSITKEDLK